MQDLKKLIGKISTLEKKVKIYERVLHFYGNPKNYGDRGEYWIIVVDGGKKARNALEEAKNVNSL